MTLTPPRRITVRGLFKVDRITVQGQWDWRITRPLETTLTITQLHGPRQFTVCRDLLAAAMLGDHGLGQTKIFAHRNHNTLAAVFLDGPHTRHIVGDLSVAEAFLTATVDLVPLGDEHVDVDAFLTKVTAWAKQGGAA